MVHYLHLSPSTAKAWSKAVAAFPARDTPARPAQIGIIALFRGRKRFGRVHAHSQCPPQGGHELSEGAVDDALAGEKCVKVTGQRFPDRSQVAPDDNVCQGQNTMTFPISCL